MREKEDNTQQKVLRVYTVLTTHTRTHTHPTHVCPRSHTNASRIRTRTNFSLATEPRTDVPSKIEASESNVSFQPANLPVPTPIDWQAEES